MGWFDDDDDDDSEDERNKRKTKPSLFSMDQMKTKDVVDGESKLQEEEEEEEEDPLDAYMKALENNPKQQPSHAGTGAASKSERLDVENEEEATSHWVEVEASNENNTNQEGVAVGGGYDDDYQQQEPSESSKNAKHALESTFHKASTASNRQVDIQLSKVHHESMEYLPFIKDFYSATKHDPNHHHTTTTASWRREHAITCHPPMDPIYHWQQIQEIMPECIQKWNTTQNISQLTLVQSQTLPVLLSGLDAIVTASTGSGKTLMYLWPVLCHIVKNNTSSSSSSSKCRALILVPTRELALQVESVAKSLLKSLPFQSLAITGGNMGRYQLSQTLIKVKPHILVATPGRLLDVLNAQQKSKTTSWLLPNITFLVLDEADKMLQLGFASQVTQILQSLRPDRQTILTSATLSKRLESHIQQDWMHVLPFTRISIGRTGTSSEHVDQHVMILPSGKAKQAFLVESLPTFTTVGRTLVFCATRDGCEQLATYLYEQSNMPALQTLHGDKHPSDRQAALKAFAKGKIHLLIATDVAGRGLDIPQVATVINYDPAKNWDTHVHRIGRAGRLNNKTKQTKNDDVDGDDDDDGGDDNNEPQRQQGSAYTLLVKSSPKDIDFAKALVSAYQREGKEISNELRGMANSSSSQSKSHHRGTNTNAAPSKNDYYSNPDHQNIRTKGNQTGLGFAPATNPDNGGGHYDTSARSIKNEHNLGVGLDQHQQHRNAPNSDYYGPPRKKKSRWG